MKPRNTAVLALMLLNTAGGIALAEPPAEAPPKTAAARTATDLNNLSAQEIQEVQQALRDSGQYKGPVDGIAGNGTAVALERFQRDRGLATDGLSKETRFELGLKPTAASRAEAAVHERPAAGIDTSRAAPDSAIPAESRDAEIAKLDADQIRELQQRLHKLGYYNGEVDGKFAASTRQALSRFYRAQAELAQRGRISPQGAQALGLDASDIQPVSGTDEKVPEPQREPARDIDAR